ncbi:MAG: NUDIX domain-containing protein [Alphaproteobacteria bacterium]|nr:NUDIX domain-containing protein [Alphaproteobacteria bacterium]
MDDQTDLRGRFETVRTEINAVLGPRARLHDVRLDGMPRVDKTPTPEALTWVTRTDTTAKAAERRTQLAVNRSHGLAVDSAWTRHDSASVRAFPTDYAVVRAGWDLGEHPPILSAGAIVFCPEDREVLLQIRSQRVATFPGCVHTLGGNYEPADAHDPHDDAPPSHLALRRCALREVQEESGLAFAEVHAAPVLVSEETETGFVQFTYAGIAVTHDEKSDLLRRRREGRLPTPDEGGWHFFSLDELARCFETGTHAGVERRFVPSGAMQLLAWLGMGAPDPHRRLPMAAQALEAYERMLPHLDRMLGTR